jgi:hypothetical protein
VAYAVVGTVSSGRGGAGLALNRCRPAAGRVDATSDGCLSQLAVGRTRVRLRVKCHTVPCQAGLVVTWPLDANPGAEESEIVQPIRHPTSCRQERTPGLLTAKEGITKLTTMRSKRDIRRRKYAGQKEGCQSLSHFQQRQSSSWRHGLQHPPKSCGCFHWKLIFDTVVHKFTSTAVKNLYGRTVDAVAQQQTSNLQAASITSQRAEYIA